MKKKLSILLSLLFLLPVVSSLGGCSAKTQVLRVYNWEEYIDEGGKGSYGDDYLGLGKNAPSMIDDFEIWYEETYGERIRVEYSTFGTTEDLYNQLKLGDKYDLVCPSEYMIMKLAAEGMLEPLDKDFFDETNENNFYVNNVSPFIRNVFKNGEMNVPEEKEVDGKKVTEQKTVLWEDYAAGYMWGTTGLVYNPEGVSEEDLSQGWKIMLDSNFRKKVTTKDNVRDSY